MCDFLVNFWDFIHPLGSTLAGITSVTGALVAWIPYVLKRPQLSLCGFIKEAPLTFPPLGMMPPRTKENYQIIYKIKNTGDKEARNVKINIVKKFQKLSQEDTRNISGFLFPQEEVEIPIPIDNSDTNNQNNCIKITLKYKGSFKRPFFREYIHQTKWFFNVTNSQRVSNNLIREERQLSAIPPQSHVKISSH